MKRLGALFRRVDPATTDAVEIPSQAPEADDALGDLQPRDRALISYFREMSPGIALMLDGPWGAGKTTYMRERGHRLARRTKKTVVALSVAGLKSRTELEQALFFAASPLFNNGYAEALGIFSRAAMRWAKIDPEDLKPKADITNKDVVVVLDDLERFAGDFDVVFGFIVELVDQHSLHVVVIGSEERIVETDNVGLLKEKIVGRTVHIRPEPAVIMASVIDGLADRASADRLSPHSNAMSIVWAKSGLGNIRAAKYAIREIVELISAMGTKFDDLGNAQHVLVEGLLIGHLETRRDAAKRQHVAEFFSHADLGVAFQVVAIQRAENAAVGTGEAFVKELFDRYDDTALLLFPGDEVFREYFLRGVVDPEGMLRCFRGLAGRGSADSPPSVLTSGPFDLGQAEFDAQVAKLFSHLRGGSISSLGLIAQIYVAAKYWAEREIIEESRDQVLQMCLDSISALDPSRVSDAHGDVDVFWYQGPSDAADNQIKQAVRAKRAEAIDFEFQQKRQGVLAAFHSSSPVSSLQEELKEWRLEPLFVGDTIAWRSAIDALGPSQIQDVIRLLGSRAQITGYEARFGPERLVLLDLSQHLLDGLPPDGRLSLLASQRKMLAEAFGKFAERVGSA